MTADAQVVVIGAGPSGISTAVALKDVGLAPLVVDRAEQIGASWRSRYDRLRLNTWRRFSHPPGRPFPKGTPTFPHRDELVAHLDRLAGEDGIGFALGTSAERVEHSGDGGWVVRTSSGELRAGAVVVATGYEGHPVIPDWPGRGDFGGELLHAAAYRNAEPFAGRSVLVVGPGCTGMEVAQDLVEGGARDVWLAVRTPPNVLLRAGPGGVPGDLIAVALWHVPTRLADAIARFAQRMDVGDLSEYGLPPAEEGVFTRSRRLGVAPTIVDEDVIASIRSRAIEVVPAVDSLDARGVTFADGRRLEPDAVICATGYRCGLDQLVGHLGVLGDRGVPREVGGRPAAPGLYFVGYVPRPGGLGSMGKEARRVARAIARGARNGSVRSRARVPA